jgi:hypothetical protein
MGNGCQNFNVRVPDFLAFWVSLATFLLISGGENVGEGAGIGLDRLAVQADRAGRGPIPQPATLELLRAGLQGLF